ncbi:hypothetical protein MBRA1_003301 [Malassezia brasiliensis]|uniref:Sec39 domain-containing protein n=1 Tax=Malassezia brasiliensis TaxID=1821822 RepID=A0AAF0E001_9BASI|nr:hypothetical protein MBRA1_003301 [Malassezia brasiliensis]
MSDAAASPPRDPARGTDHDALAMDAPPEDARRALLSALPAPAAQVAVSLEAIDDPWWVAAACVAAVHAAGRTWTAADVAHVLSIAAARTAPIDAEIQDALDRDTLDAYLDAGGAARWAQLLLRRKLWLMQWLLRIPLASDAPLDGDIVALAEQPLLTHAQTLCLAGRAVELRALLGAHVAVGRALFPYRFVLLHALITAGGVPADELLRLRLLPGTKMPVEDSESGAWIELAAKATTPAAAAALWVEHPAVVARLVAQGYVAPLGAPPTPPSALSAWYLDVINELEAELGLVDPACALAEAGVRLSLVPLRAVAHELRFLRLLSYTLSYGAQWSRATLHDADARTIVQSVVAQPQSVGEVVTMLQEHVMPFLQKGTYADPGAFRGASASDAAAELALLVLALRNERSLAIAAQIVLTWIEDPVVRRRLALAMLTTCDETDDAAYVALHSLASLSTTAPPARAEPLVAIIGHAADASPRARLAQLSVASDDAIDAALGQVGVCVDLGRMLLRHTLAHPVRFYVGLDEARTKTVCATLWRAARGSDAALVALVDDVAPFVARRHVAAWRPLPVETPTWLLAQLLAHRAFGAFGALAAHLAQHATLAVASNDAAQLALDAARAWIAQATSCDPLQAPLPDAAECLAHAPPMPAVEAEQRFLALMGQIARYPVPSLRDADAPLTPDEVRALPDRLVLLARILALHPSAYRAPQIRTLARALAAPAPTALAEVRIDAMLADAAAAAGDYTAARDLCERAARGAQALPHDAEHEVAHAAAWRACFQLAKAPEVPDARARARLLGQALALAPPTELPRVLAAWRAAPPHAGVPPAPGRAPSRTLARFLGSGTPRRSDSPRQAAPATPEDAATTQRTRALFDRLQSASPGARPSALLGSTASLREVVNTSLTRGMGWWMGENTHSEAR